MTAALKREAAKAKILLVESITKGGAITAYEAKIKTGGKTAEVRVAPDGSPAK